MSEEQTPTEITLSPEDKQALERFKKAEAEKKREDEANQLMSDLLKAPNQELNRCVNDCALDKNSDKYDKFKDDTSQKLLNIKEELSRKMGLVMANKDLTKEVMDATKVELVKLAKKEFQTAVNGALEVIATREKDLNSKLFSNNIRLSEVDTAIIQNQTLLEPMLKQPFSFMDQQHGEANAAILLMMAGRGYVAEVFTANNGLNDAADMRFSSEIFKGIKNIRANRESLLQIEQTQIQRFNALDPNKGAV